MTGQRPLPAFQTIFSRNGDALLLGQWDSRALFDAITGPNESYWAGRRVLDIGANSSGLSVEIARRGASVVAIEPDPYRNNKSLAKEHLDELIADESLDLTLGDEDLFHAHTLGGFDTVLCLGLIYHFRDPQFVLDYLSTIDMGDLVISTQTHPGDHLALTNRKDPSVLPARMWEGHTDALSGWHPTRPLFVRMLQSAGFEDIVALTDERVNFPDKPLPGLTNSAYYRAARVRRTDPDQSRKIFHPR